MTKHLKTQIFLILLFLFTTNPIVFGQNTVELRGTVETTSGETLPGVNIILNDGSYGTVSGMDGDYIIRGLKPGNYSIQASFMGYDPFQSEIEIKNNATAEQNIILTPKTYTIDDVVVVGKSVATQINEQAYAVASVSTANLFNSTANVKEVLDKVPGVRIMEDGGLGSDINFTINGFSGDQVKFFMDGLPMDNFGSSLGFGDIPVNMIERIDVYKGVVPVWLGTDALGGAVNIITSKKRDFLDVSYSAGSFNTHNASVNFASTNAKSGLTIRGNAFYNYSDNNYKVWVPITNSNNQVVDTAEVERFHDRYISGTVKLEAGLVNKNYADNLLIGIIASGNDNQIQHGSTMERVYGGITQNSRSLIPAFRYNKKDILTDGLDISLYSAINITESESIDTLRGVRYNWLGETFQSESNDGEFSRTFTTFDEKEFLSQMNVSYAFHPMHSVAVNYSYNHFDREAFDRKNPNDVPNRFPKSLSKLVAGLAYKWDRHEKWNTTLFGKMYHLNAWTSQLMDFGLETQRTIEVESNKQNFGYGLASSWFPFGGLQLKASYEHTYRMPTPLEIFGDGLFVDPNAELGPEHSNNLNAGLDYRFRLGEHHRINMGATYVYREARDLIYTIVQVASPVTYYDNLSQTRTNGMEGNFQYQWKDFLHLGGNITFQDITDQSERVFNESYTGTGWQKNYHYGFRIPNQPYLFGSINAAFRFRNVLEKTDDLSLSYHFNFVEEYYLTWSQNPKYIIPQQMSHNIELSYSFKNGRYNISAQCDNLLNERLYDKYYLQKPGRSFAVKLRYSL